MSTFDVEEQWPFLNDMHPAHLRYIKELPLNTLRFYLRTLNELEPDKRYEFAQAGGYLLLWNDDNQDELHALMNDKDRLFEEFGLKCIQASKVFHEALIVLALNYYILNQLSHRGDQTNVDTVKSRLVGLAEHILRKEKERTAETNQFVDSLVSDASNLEELTKERYDLYVYFCENVLLRLEEERKMWEEQLSNQYREDDEDSPEPEN